MRNDVDYYNLFGLEKPGGEDVKGTKEQEPDISGLSESGSASVEEGIDIESIDVDPGAAGVNTGEDGSGTEPLEDGQTEIEGLPEEGITGTDTGEKERVSDMGKSEMSDTEPGDTEPKVEPQVQQQEKKKQSDEENARYAAARRKAEQEKAIELRRAEEEIISQLGLENPYTHKPVRTVEEYQEYHKTISDIKKEQFKESHNLDDDGYKELISGIPEVQEAQAVKSRLEAQQEAQRQEDVNRMIESHVREIMKYEPDVKSAEDIARLPEGMAIAECLQNGMDLLQAYRITSFDRMTRKAEEEKTNLKMQAKAEVNKVKSKNHLKKVSGNQGDGSPSVPQDVLRLYRKMMPDLNDREIYEHYKKYAKNRED